MNIVNQWITYLRREYPTLAFKSNTQSNTKQHGSLTSYNHIKNLQNINDNNTQHKGSIGGSALLELLKNYSRSLDMKKSITVGVCIIVIDINIYNIYNI